MLASPTLNIVFIYICYPLFLDVTTPPNNVEMLQSDHGSFALKKDQHNKRGKY